MNIDYDVNAGAVQESPLYPLDTGPKGIQFGVHMVFSAGV